MENSNTEFKHRGLLWKKVEPQDSETEVWQYRFFFNLEKNNSLFAKTKKFRWTLQLHGFRLHEFLIDSEISEPSDILDYLLNSEHRINPIVADYKLECLRVRIDESMIKV